MQLDRRAEMTARRQAQHERIPMTIHEKVSRHTALNLRRAKAGLHPLRPRFGDSRNRHTGAMLRAIRARTHNFKGELQR
jgi:hypothetical protein